MSEIKDTDVIKTIRFPLAILVVLIHSFIPISDTTIRGSVAYWTNMSSGDWYTVLGVSLSTILARGAVPLFFFISGYLFYFNMDNWKWSVWFNKLKRRSRSLTLPYLLWITIALLIPLIYFGLAAILKDRPFIERVSNWVELHGGMIGFYWNDLTKMTISENMLHISVAHTFPFLMPMWYVRDLMVLVLISPLIYFYVKQTKGIGVFLLFVGYFLEIDCGIPGLSFTGLFFFTMGGAFSVSKSSFSNIFAKMNHWWFNFLAIVLFVMCLLSGAMDTVAGKVIMPIWTVCEIVVICNLIKTICEKRQKLLQFFVCNADSTYFIFAFHGVVIGYVSTLLMNVFSIKVNHMQIDCEWINGHLLQCVLSYLLTPVVTVFISVIMYRMICKIMPRMHWILTANRMN